MLRYVERNALRANLVERAQDWPWSSLCWWSRPNVPEFLHEGPVDRGRRWVADVNRAMSDLELEAIRRNVQRGRPLGTQRWQRLTAVRLGLEASLRPRGRPRKTPKK